MKHGRPLIAALEQLDRAADRRSTPSGPHPARHDAALRPIRPGAFAAWATRREPSSPAAAPAVPAGARLLRRPPAV